MIKLRQHSLGLFDQETLSSVILVHNKLENLEDYEQCHTIEIEYAFSSPALPY